MLEDDTTELCITLHVKFQRKKPEKKGVGVAKNPPPEGGIPPDLLEADEGTRLRQRRETLKHAL